MTVTVLSQPFCVALVQRTGARRLRRHRRGRGVVGQHTFYSAFRRIGAGAGGGPPGDPILEDGENKELFSMAWNEWMWMDGCGWMDVDGWMWMDGCGWMDVDGWTLMCINA